MIDNAFELVTQTMERQYPDHVAFRYVAADGETVVEKITGAAGCRKDWKPGNRTLKPSSPNCR